ncbi:transcriptional regulator [Massilia sp. NR 4-1]|nr:transcriptional regulator [Massilia sp. NR 4-1]
MGNSPVLPAWQKLSTKLVGALLLFLAAALTVIGSTLFLSWQLEGSAAAINDTGSLRMNSYRLSALLGRLETGDELGLVRNAATQQISRIDGTLALLRQGDPQRPLFLPPNTKIRNSFSTITRHWQDGLRPMARTILAQEAADPVAIRTFQKEADQFVAQVNTLVKLIEQDSELRTFWLRASQLALLGLALVTTISIIFLLFSLIIEPVTRLYEGMSRMREAQFEVRLDVDSDDEFGQLAQGFNQMGDRLQDLYGNLEALVKVKTQALEEQNRELALLYDCSAFLQRPQPAEELCEGFLHRISEYFKADGGSVRIIDAQRGNVHMLVHHGVSDELVESEHCLKVGDCLCGEAVEMRIAVVHDMRRIDQAHEKQCYREGFVTVSVFHIFAHGQHVGFFNLHFRQAKVFSPHEKELLETLGQQLGIAIENMRLATREREMAISEERNLVAQGLHDSIAQGLNFLNLQVQMLEQSLKQGEIGDVAEIVPQLRAGVQESYEDVRELLHNFRSKLAEGSLTGSLETTIDKFRRQTGIEVELISDGEGAPFPREQQLQLLFIVQEALSNVRKHALATRVEIGLQDHKDFSLSIHDNGRGFDAATLSAKSEEHVGIHIMRERAARIGAELDVRSGVGLGTTVQLTLARAQRRAA